jgi:hypothetical protein
MIIDYTVALRVVGCMQEEDAEVQGSVAPQAAIIV